MPIDNARIFDLMDEQFKSEGRYDVVKGIEGDKKKAAESIAIENDTGADSKRVYGDYDSFSKRRKSEIAQTLVEDDKWLLEYVKKNPLASTVSNDDWHNLSNFTSTARRLVEVNPIIKLYKNARYLYDIIYPGDSSYFMRGFVTGLTQNNPDLGAEFVEGMSYNMPEFFQPKMFSGAKAIRDFAASIKPEGYERSTTDMWNVHGVGDAFAFGMEAFGEAVSSMVPGAIGGLAGTAAGAATPVPGGALIGGIAGLGSVSYAMGYGELYKALKAEGIDPAIASKYSTAFAVPIAALDAISMKMIGLKALTAGMKKDLTKYVAVRIAKEVAKGATTEGLTETAQEIIKDAVVSYAADKQFGTEEQIKGWIESGVIGGLTGGIIQGGAAGVTGRRDVNKDLQDVRKTADATKRVIENADPWIKAGQKPPIGLDPVIDHMLMLDSKERLEVLDAIIEDGDKAETKELSPTLWQELNKIIFEKKQIEIRWDAVKSMYGDKLPEADDKLLGFVPNIQQQFANSNLTGESIKVDIADWVGKVDPEVNRMLHDDLAFSDGMSINEANTKPKVEDISEIPETEIPGLSQELDKPYSLKKGEEGVYDILDEHGALATRVRVVENEGGKNLHIHFRTGQIDVAGLRTLMKQLKEEFPDAETITSPKMPGVEALRRGLEGSNITVGMPFRVKESTVDIVRRSAGLEPLFDLPREGPRAVRLVRNKGIPIARGDVNFTITDEVGNPIGEVTGALRQKGRDYYIDWIGAPLDDREVGSNLVNKLGPKLIRGLFREFKRELPGVKTLTGFRVTGARGTYSQGEVVQINLARLMEEQEKAPAGWEGVEPAGPETQKLVDLTQGYTQFGPKLWAQRSREWTPQELALEKKITKLMDKIVPREVRVYGAEDIRIGSGHRRISGVFQAFHDRRPLIMWSLPDPEGFAGEHPEGTARHEALHFLRQYGYIRENEWKILEKLVKDNNLIKKHGIDTRYWYADEEIQIEEAIAEEFRTWEGRGSDPEHWGAKVFQRIREILDAIKSAYREYLGREPTVNDIFRDIDIGRTGRRTPTAGPMAGRFGDPGLHRTVNIQPKAMEPIGKPEDILRDVGFTDSEIRRGISAEQQEKVQEGYLFWGGSLTKATPELLEQFKKEAAEDVKRKAEDTKKLNAAFAQKAAYPPLGHILGSDWGAGSKGNTPKEYRDTAYRTLEQKYSFNQIMVGKVERALARQPAPYAPGGPVEGEVPTFEPGAIMDKARYAKYMRHINERNNEDAQKELEDAEREVRRKQKPEWKAKEAEMRIEVTKEIANRPDWKVSQFFRNGMFFGMDSKYRPKLDPQFLTPEQAAGLPDGFIRKGGMDPDMLAGSFGYSSGQAMVNRMVEFERVKGKLGPKEFFDEMVKQETNRRMELKYGKLAEEVLKEAMDHVIGTTQMDLLHEETMALALRAGQEFSLTKEDFRDQAALRFHEETASQISMRGYFREMYRAGKAAELAFLNGDFVEAFKQKQQQVHLFTLAEMAKKFEKTQKQLDEIIKRYNKRDHDVNKIPPEFVEWIHSILFQINRPPRRLPEDLARLIATRDSKSLEAFVNDKNYIVSGNEEFETEVNPKLVVWDRLMEVDQNGIPTYSKKFDELTVGEVKLINISLQSLNKIGRDEGKYNTQYESRVKRDLIGQMKNQLSRLREKAETKEGSIRAGLQWIHGGLVQLEGLFDRWDKGNRSGLFTKMFSFPLSKASDDFSVMQREFARRIVALDKKLGLTWKEMRRLVDNDVFYNPKWMELDENKKLIDNGKWLQMTKQHVRGVLLNWGNPSNRKRLAEGYFTTEEKIQAWLDKVADKRDYDWAAAVGEMYKDIQKDSDEMTYRMSGTLIELLPLPKFQTPHGEYRGYYYPIIYDRSLEGGPRLAEERPPPTVQLTYTGWQRKRTGSAGPLDLSIGEMGNHISRRLKDNAFREVLHNIHKIWSDKEFRKAVRRYHGDYAVNILDSAYKDFAGHTGITSGVSNAANKFAEMIRQNTIGALIGLNPGTVAKHGLSALLQSWKEAGILKEDFYKSMVLLSTPGVRDKYVKFMMEGGMVGDLDFKGSGTLQRRHQHYQETIGGAGDIQLRSLTLREKSLRIGSMPVAMSDMYSSQILWHATYTKIMDKLDGTMSIEEAHVQAEEQANYAVRRTHGSTAITSRPEFMRSQSAMTRYLTSLYGFFNHIYNRFYRMAWTAKDLRYDWWHQEKTRTEVLKGAADLTTDFMMYIVGPALIETIVVEAAMSADWEDMGIGDLLQKGMVHTVSASVPLVREVVHAVVTGHDPAAGLIGTAMKGFTDVARDWTKEEMDNGKAIQHGLTLLAISTGLGSTQVARWARFFYDLQTGEQEPQDFEEYYRAFRSGSIEMRKGH